MPPTVLKIVQHKHSVKRSQANSERPQVDATQPRERKSSLLFVHRDLHNAQTKFNATESGLIKRHLAQRHERKRKGQTRLELHPLTGRILSRFGDEELADRKDENDAKQQTGDAVPADPSTSGKRIRIDSVQETTLSIHDLGRGSLDPFTASCDHSPGLARLLYLYGQNLLPLARTVSSEWDWADRLPVIQSSPMLSFAIGAYVSAFFTGMRQGSRGVVLPPPVERGRPLLWPMPTWFQYYCRAIEMLNQALSNQNDADKHAIFHTITFLLRLSILFGDGITGRVHIKAFEHVARLQGRDTRAVSRDLAVTKINLITLFLYKEVLFKTVKGYSDSGESDYTIKPDVSKWTDDHEWHKFQGMLFCRSLTWNAQAPGAIVHEHARANILRLDPGSDQRLGNSFAAFVKHYQVALYLWHYLVGIALDTSLPKIRYHLDEIKQYLRRVDLRAMESDAPRTVFMILFIGAFASRGQVERRWFIEKLATARVQLRIMRDIHYQLSGFCDPIHCQPILLEEILIEIKQVRDGVHTVRKRDLYQGEVYLPSFGPTPMSKSPNLKTPLRVLESIENG